MTLPSLGYSDDVRIEKCEIARLQLVEAISLFLRGNYVCALTLAGAAEEIFARLLNAMCIPSTIEESFISIQTVKEQTPFAVMDGKPKCKIFNEWNAARNELKHHDKEGAEIITINLFDEAYWMVRRALSNASNAGIVIINAGDFESWVICNINL